MKGMSAVIEAVALLAVTVAVAGYIMLSVHQVTDANSNATQEQLNQQAGKSFRIISVSNSTVTLRNTGQVALMGFAFYVNNQAIAFAGPQTLAPNQSANYTVTLQPGTMILKISSSGGSQTVSTTIS